MDNEKMKYDFDNNLSFTIYYYLKVTYFYNLQKELFYTHIEKIYFPQ